MAQLDLAVTAHDGRELLAAAAQDWSRPVPHCPEWNAAELVAHVGGVLDWVGKIVTSGERVSRRDREPAPQRRDELPDWYRRHLDRALETLSATDPDKPVWTFSSREDQRAGWWRRRLAVELAIHRWDAEHAACRAAAHAVGHGPGAGPAPAPLEPAVAAAGIGEFFTEFLPGLLAQPQVEGLTGTLHVHATDGDCEWWIDLDARGEAVAEPKHAKGDTAIRGARSDLLLWLTNRVAATGLEVFGNEELALRWPQLRR